MTKIEVPAKRFINDTEIERVIVGNDCEKICDSAFEGCSSLTSIEIGNKVKSIGNKAFYDCIRLKEVHISNIVDWCSINFGNAYSNPLYYAKKLYLNRESVTTLEISETIKKYTFINCKGITSVIIGNSVTSIGSGAFYGCTGLTSVTIGNKVTNIESAAFSGCTGLTNIEIPNSVASIGNEAFNNCTGLKTVINFSNLTFSKGSKDNGYIAYYADKVINAPNGKIVGDFIFSKPNGVNTLVGYLGNATELTLPADYNGENYVIGTDVFKGNTTITSITIPNSVTSIGDSAFEGCSGLTSITIPNSVTSIGKDAFSGCSGLTSIIVESGNMYYDSRDNCNAIIETETNTLLAGCKNTVIPNSVTSIGSSAFSGCTGLTSIIIPNSVTSIGNKAFFVCTGLKTVENYSISFKLKKGDDSYGYVACYADKVFNYFTINNYNFINKNGVDNANTLVEYTGSDKNINLPIISLDNYNKEQYIISENVFKNNTTITTITIPYSVTSIEDNENIEGKAFSGCTNLKTIFNYSTITLTKGEYGIGNNIVKIVNAPDGFEYQSAILFLNESGVYTFANYSGTASNYKIPEKYANTNITSIGDYAFVGNRSIQTIEIPNTITSIGNYAFKGIESINTVTIGNSVLSIGEEAFKDCTGLKTVINLSNLTFSKGSPEHGYVAYYADNVYNAPSGSIEGDFIFGKPNDVNTLLYYLGNATELTLPANYKGDNYAIGADVFKGNTTITSITIPEKVTRIGYDAFRGCTGLTNVEFNAEDCKYDYKSSMFSNCTALSTVIIGENVKTIPNCAFFGCEGLTSVTIGNNVTNIGYSAFSGCIGITSVVIPNSVTSIGESAFRGCSKLKYVSISNKITLIDYGLFYECTGLTSITIPNSVTSIGDKAFYNCGGLTSVTIGNSVTSSIGSEAFYGCKSLKTVYNLSNLITFTKNSSGNGYIAKYAENVYNATNNDISLNGDFIFTNNLTTNILVGYFDNTTTNLVLPANYNNGNYTIGANAFYGCSWLTSVTIPNSVILIGSSAFQGCSGLTSIEIPNSVITIGEYAFGDCYGFTSITIPNSVKSIGNDAFNGCRNLEEVYLVASTPSKIGENVFLNTNSNLKIYVPESSLNNYKTIWSAYANYIEGYQQ